MPYFATADEVHEHVGGLLQAVVADDAAAGPLTRTDVVLRLDLRNPVAEVTLDLRGAEGPSATLGPSELPPHVTLRMECDTAHRFLLGTQNVPVAVARGRIQADGDAARVVGVLDLPRHTAERYAGLLRAAGREDLAGAREDAVGVLGGPTDDAPEAAAEAPAADRAVDPGAGSEAPAPAEAPAADDASTDAVVPAADVASPDAEAPAAPAGEAPEPEDAPAAGDAPAPAEAPAADEGPVADPPPAGDDAPESGAATAEEPPA